MNRIFKPTLEDYGEFAEKIGFKATKIDGVFLYKCGETILRPFELGNLYRLCHLKYSEGVDDCLNILEYYVKKSKNNKELQENLNEYIKYMKESSEINKNKLK